MPNQKPADESFLLSNFVAGLKGEHTSLQATVLDEEVATIPK